MLNADAIIANHNFMKKLSDRLLFWQQESRSIAASIELKSGSGTVSSILEQLQQGANYIQGLVGSSTVEFYPIVVHKNLPQSAVRLLAGSYVKYGREKYRVVVRHSNSPLAVCVN